MSNATKSLGPTMAKRKIASDQKDETSFQPSIVAPKPKKLKEVHKKAAVGERQSQLLNTQDIAMATVDLEHYGTEVIAVDHQPTNNALHVEEEGQCATLTACGSKPDTPEATPAASSSNIASKTTKNVVNANNKTGKGRIEKNWEKIEFIIQTRDNIKPDPYGIYSTTAGPLPWEKGVMVQYNEKYNVNVGAANMEKQYRKNIKEYYERNPDYPHKENIIYTGAKPGKKQKPEMENDNKSTNSGSHDDQDHGKQKAGVVLDGVEVIDFNESLDDKQSKEERVLYKDGYGGCKPPHDITQATDIQNYFKLARPIRENERARWLTVVVENWRGQPCGNVDVPLQDLRASSAYVAELLEEALKIDLSLQNVGLATLARYVDCISPPKGYLPKYDFALARLQNLEGHVRRKVVVSRISWTGAATVDLYGLATQLNDDRVRNLILEHWRYTEIEMEQDDINRLFESTESKDPARRFWVAYLRQQQIAVTDDEGWYPALVESVRPNLDLQHNPTNPLGYDNTYFYRLYHHHNHNRQACSLDKSQLLQRSEPDFKEVARRVLRVARREHPEDFLAPRSQRKATVIFTSDPWLEGVTEQFRMDYESLEANAAAELALTVVDEGYRLVESGPDLDLIDNNAHYSSNDDAPPVSDGDEEL